MNHKLDGITLKELVALAAQQATANFNSESVKLHINDSESWANDVTKQFSEDFRSELLALYARVDA